MLYAIYSVADEVYQNSNQTQEQNTSENKQPIRLTESDLRNIVRGVVRQVLAE